MSDSGPTSDASSAAEAFFGALRRGEWIEAAAMVDPEAAAAFRTSALVSLVGWAQHRLRLQQMREQGVGMVGWSSDGRLDSGLLEQYGSTPFHAVPGVRTLAELAAMSPAAFIAKYLEVSNPELGAAGSESGARLTRRVLGVIVEGDAVAHVLYRGEGPGIEYTDPYHVELTRLRRRHQLWRVDLTSTNNDFASGGALMMLTEDLSELAGTESERHPSDGESAANLGTDS